MKKSVATIIIGAITLLIFPSLFVQAGGSGSTKSLQPGSNYSQSPRIQVVLLENAGEVDETFDLVSQEDLDTLRSFFTDLFEVGAPAWPNLGWRGFHLFNDGVPDIPDDVRVFEGVIRIGFDENAHYFIDARGLEFWLTSRALEAGLSLPSIPNEGDGDIKPILPGPINDGLTATQVQPQPLPLSGSEPPYEPNRWNQPNVRRENNCYNYARNMVLRAFGRPGAGTPQSPPAPGNPGYNCAAFVAAAQADGLVPVNCANACPRGSYKVALVLDPNGGNGLSPDYHWYRQDNNGRWSHKPGATEVTDTDSSGNQINDPRNADRRRSIGGGRFIPGYTDFCGCFCVRVP